MNRREAVALLAAAGFWPAAALAQYFPTPDRIGFLMGFSEGDRQAQATLNAFHQGMKDLGIVEGRDLTIEYRWAGGDRDKARAFARELAALRVDLVVASTNQVVAIAMQEIKTIPIVFVFIGDPIGSHFAATLARPGGNLTGFSNFEGPIGGKWLQLLKEVAPLMRRVGFVVYPGVSAHVEFLNAAQDAAAGLGVEVTAISVASPKQIDERVSAFGRGGEHGGLIVPPHALTVTQRKLFVDLADRYRLAGVYGDRFFAESGGLMSFGINLPDQIRRSVRYVDLILKGADPAELPVQLPTRYELLINIKAAQKLGVEVSPLLLARADEVIE